VNWKGCLRNWSWPSSR